MSVVSLLPVLLVGPDCLLKVVHFFSQLLSLAHQAFLNGEERGRKVLASMPHWSYIYACHMIMCTSHDCHMIVCTSHDCHMIVCTSHDCHMIMCTSHDSHIMVTCRSHDMHLHACRTRPEMSRASSSAVPCPSPVAPTSH